MAKRGNSKRPVQDVVQSETALPSPEFIDVTGARVHNLRNIDISIPKNQLVVITGISGSGKSSLAFDTIYAEGQRRYMESFSAYARQFIGDMERPDVDRITGLSPVISIEQKTTNKNPRSTVGTVTEIYDFMRLLYARIGEPFSYETGKPMVKWSEEEIVTNIFKKFKGKKITILAPVVRGRKGHYRELFEEIRKKGYLKVRVDGDIKDLVPKMQVDRYKIHDIELVIDRLLVNEEFKVRISQSVQQALKVGKDLMFVVPEGETAKKTQQTSYSRLLMCEDSGISYEEPSPNTFSFNSPYGACPACKGLGTMFHINDEAIVPDTTLSVKEGGIAPLGEERDAFVYRQVQDFAKRHKISLSVPIAELSTTSLNLLLYGNEEGTESAIDMDQLSFDPQGPYEGIVNMLKRWFQSGYSEGLREWAEGFMLLKDCEVCQGARLKKESLWFRIDGKNIAQLCQLNLDNLAAWLDGLELRISGKQQLIAKDVLKEIRDRLQFLLNVGLTYLTLNRPSKTLSGGESQRIRLATQIGSQLRGITYVLDEPSIGLHQRDNHKLIEALKDLRDIGNSVLVVEHDKDIMLAADQLVDIGPKAGLHGGRVVAQGPPGELLKLDTLTSGSLFLPNAARAMASSSRSKGPGATICRR
jgi:excinuclease ABC subunit A